MASLGFPSGFALCGIRAEETEVTVEVDVDADDLDFDVDVVDFDVDDVERGGRLEAKSTTFPFEYAPSIYAINPTARDRKITVNGWKPPVVEPSLCRAPGGFIATFF